ncbi:MAG: hypothetical protein DELT_00252 [Desulfovibrio sp.]
MRNIVHTLLIIGMLALTSCAAGKPPFMSESDWSIQQKLMAELAEYHDLRIVVSGGRVYLDGEVPNVPDRNRAVAAAQEAKGVTGVVENLFLTEVGADGPDPYE